MCPEWRCQFTSGAEYEHQTLVAFSDLIDAGYDAGIPILAVTAVGREMARDARYLSLSSRIAAEMGANIVKTYYCGELRESDGTCPVPIVMAGGKKLPEMEALTMAYNAVSEGAVGVDMGRHLSVRLPRWNDQGCACCSPPIMRSPRLPSKSTRMRRGWARVLSGSNVEPVTFIAPCMGTACRNCLKTFRFLTS